MWAFEHNRKLLRSRRNGIAVSDLLAKEQEKYNFMQAFGGYFLDFALFLPGRTRRNNTKRSRNFPRNRILQSQQKMGIVTDMGCRFYSHKFPFRNTHLCRMVRYNPHSCLVIRHRCTLAGQSQPDKAHIGSRFSLISRLWHLRRLVYRHRKRLFRQRYKERTRRKQPPPAKKCTPTSALCKSSPTA